MIFSLLIPLLVYSLFVDASKFSRGSKRFSKKRDYTFSKYENQECKSDQLTCVPDEDCELECPYGFIKLREGGACYFISNEDSNKMRTLTDAEDFCENINTRLLWIEDSKELQDIIQFGEDPDTSVSGKYFIAAEYSKDHGSWIWRGTHDEIDWEIILFQTPNAEQSLDEIENANINKCLVLELPPDDTSTQSLIKESECIENNLFICKMGEARARCSKSATTKCCYSPSYDFYQKNREIGFSSLNLRPGDCQIKIGDELNTCEDVLSSLPASEDDTNKYSPMRVGSSYYYIANGDDDCIGRNAIIQSEDVHDFVTILMATKENTYETIMVKIGLTYELEDEKAHWVNGKPADYYSQFWAPGEPKRDESVDGGCGAYESIQEKAIYLWALFSQDMCEGFDKICELPLYQSTSTTTASEQKSCGKRYERGVLAKSVHSVYSTDEANFGEFPWQAAIMYPEKYGREVKRKFACSGALIHKSFVLTSAHCTSSSVHKDFVVLLGQHDLNSDDALLEPVTADVKEVIVHQDYQPRKSFLDDLALLQLDEAVDLNLNPHIGLGCLPDPDEIRSHGGDWECYITGWSRERRYRSGSFILKRLEADFTSERYCRFINREYYDYVRYNKRRYSHGSNYHSSEDPQLLCTTFENQRCLDDQSPILVCKKATEYVKRPFFGKNRKIYKRSTNEDVYKKPVQSVLTKNKDVKKSNDKPYTKPSRNDNEYIINAYGEDRYDSDKWYIIGIGNALSECREPSRYYHNSNYGREKYDYDNHEKEKYLYRFEDHRQSSSNQNRVRRSFNQNKVEVFTSVYEYYYNFISYVLDFYYQ